ncbi:MAG: hypothetical protein U5K72_17210 [Balneolaceae bacterium]|nr:hypothetical protein [Balneolaceae bacterium]
MRVSYSKKRVPVLPDSLPTIDLKAAALIHNQFYQAGDHIDDLLDLPDGFVDPKCDDIPAKTQSRGSYTLDVSGFVQLL